MKQIAVPEPSVLAKSWLGSELPQLKPKSCFAKLGMELGEEGGCSDIILEIPSTHDIRTDTSPFRRW